MVFFPDKVCFELRSPLFWEKPERRVINYSIFHDELAYTTNILKIMINRLLKKKHLTVRRLNYVYNIQVIIKMDLKNHNNRNVQSNKNISHRITLC